MDTLLYAIVTIEFPEALKTKILFAVLSYVKMVEGIGKINNTPMSTASKYFTTLEPKVFHFEFVLFILYYDLRGLQSRMRVPTLPILISTAIALPL
jgi:hypothetical protein